MRNAFFTVACVIVSFLIQAGSAQSTSSVQAANIEQVRYAEQYSGADINAKINAAIATCPLAGCTVRVPAGSFPSVSTTVTVPPGVWVRGDGAAATVINYTGTGDGFLVEAGDAGPYRTGGIESLTLNGSGAGGSANGIHQVNTIGFSYSDLAVEDFGGAGLWIDNEAPSYCTNCGSGFSERTQINGVSLFQNDTDLKFSRSSASASNSVMYTWVRGLHLQINNGQTGIALVGDGGSNPV